MWRGLKLVGGELGQLHCLRKKNTFNKVNFIDNKEFPWERWTRLIHLVGHGVISKGGHGRAGLGGADQTDDDAGGACAIGLWIK